MNIYGFNKNQWSSAKSQAKQEILIKCVKNPQHPSICYSELANKIIAISLEAHDPRLAHLLGEISSEENTADRGMLSVFVVHKGGDERPGNGFFKLAKTLGYNIGRKASEKDKFWQDQRKMVIQSWKN